MNLSSENIVWLELAGKETDTSPEVFLNALIRSVREELGRPDGTPLVEWLKRGETTESKIAETLAAWKESRVIVEEASRTARLYIQRMESGREVQP